MPTALSQEHATHPPDDIAVLTLDRHEGERAGARVDFDRVERIRRGELAHAEAPRSKPCFPPPVERAAVPLEQTAAPVSTTPPMSALRRWGQWLPRVWLALRGQVMHDRGQFANTVF